MKKAFGCLSILLACGFLLLWFLSQNVADVRPAARRTDCANRLKQFVLALHSYHDVHGTLPPAVVYDENGKPMHSWRALILPYIEENKAFESYDFDQPWNSPGNLAVAAKLKSDDFLCPEHGTESWWGGTSEPVTRFTNYVAVTGPGTAFDGDSKRRLDDFPDGTSRTILLVEFAGSDIQLLEPRDITAEEFIAAYKRSARPPAAGDREGAHKTSDSTTCELSRHPAGFNVGLADGSVRCVSRATDLKTIRAITTIASGEVANEF